MASFGDQDRTNNQNRGNHAPQSNISKKTSKAGGVDNIPPEAMKALNNIAIDKFHHILNRIWEKEQTPEDWTK